MENFRDFEIGPDPFGRTYHVLFKYLQTAISIRHSDSVDVCFLLDTGDTGSDNAEERLVRTIVIPHADMRAFALRSGRKVSDSWCSRLAACKLRNAVETGEDIDKEFLIVTPHEIEEYDTAIGKWETEWLKAHAA
jgi:hypothetical protein